jgi:dephospho-CoA kinase
MSDRIRQVGVTGGIGSGKSMVCAVFALLGVPVYDADQRARELLATDPDLKSAVRRLFGDKAFFPDGSPDRGYLASLVFADAELLGRLNGIVHPAVRRDYGDWILQQAGQRYVIREAALLVETGLYRELDILITVAAPEAERIRRVLLRDPHRTLDQVRGILAQQIPEEEKIALSDYIIRNDNQSLILPQVLKIHAELIR